MSTLRDDLRYSIRTLSKTPAFTLTAALTIALGIGATTAIFSVVNAVLLRSLPYAEPDRLAFVQSDLAARNVNDFPLPPGDLPDLRRDVSAFEAVAAVVTNRTTFAIDDGDPAAVTTANVTANFFRTLKSRFLLGRDFVEEDAAVPPPQPEAGAAQQQGPPPPQLRMMVVLSHGFWQRAFGSDPDIVGRTFRLNQQQTAEVVGVLEPGFELLWPKASDIEPNPDLYVAMRVDFENASRVNVFLRVVGRLRPGATIAQAQEQANTIVADLRERFPIKETAGLRWRVEPMHAYVVAGVRPLLVALMGAVVFVLLIACANVANLMLVRSIQRERELVVRAALGGGRWTLLRQTLVESLLIAFAGAALGVGLAWVAIRVLITSGPQDLPRLEHVNLDPVVLGFTLGTSVLAALVFGIVPALRASRTDVADSLRTSGRSSSLSGAGRLMRNGVVVAEVALAFVLLVGSGLMIRSFSALQRAEPGFDAGGVLLVQIANQGRPTADERAALMQQMREGFARIPGVTAVSAASTVPLEGTASNVRWGTEAALTDPAQFQQADFRIIPGNYFEVMRTRLLEGRVFNEADNTSDPGIAIIDDVFARKAFPGTSAVGKRFLARTAGPEPDWYEVVGVVQHQRNESLSKDSRETMYMPDAHVGFGATDRWLLRTTGDPLAIVPAARNELRNIDRTLVIAAVQPLNALVDQSRAPTRFALMCIGVFAVLAAILASIGLYGVLATAVRQRTGEIGMRMALGATARDIFAVIVSQGVLLSAGGIVIGVLAAFWLTRLMTTLLVGVEPTDPTTFITIVASFQAIAALACCIPALRAARLQPAHALRE